MSSPKRIAKIIICIEFFNAKAKPRFFTSSGSFDEFCTKEAVKYRGFF
jgi:hypothetical protein